MHLEFHVWRGRACQACRSISSALTVFSPLSKAQGKYRGFIILSISPVPRISPVADLVNSPSQVKGNRQRD